MIRVHEHHFNPLSQAFASTPDVEEEVDKFLIADFVYVLCFPKLLFCFLYFLAVRN